MSSRRARLGTMAVTAAVVAGSMLAPMVPARAASTVRVSKSTSEFYGDGVFHIGEHVDWLVSISSYGDTPTTVSLQDDLFPGTGSVNCAQNGPWGPCPDLVGGFTLPPGGGITVWYRTAVTSQDVASGQVTNTAVVTQYDSATGQVVDRQSSTATATIDPAHLYRVEKRSRTGQTTRDLGTQWQISGNIAVTPGAVLTIDDPMVEEAGGTWTCRVPAGVAVAPTITVASEGDLYCWTDVSIPESYIVNDRATNVATVSYGNATVSPQATVQVLTPGTTTTKTAVTNDLNGNGVVDAGDSIAWTIEARNVGNADLANVVIRDPQMPQGAICQVSAGTRPPGPRGASLTSVAGESDPQFLPVGAMETCTYVTPIGPNTCQVSNTATTTADFSYRPGGSRASLSEAVEAFADRVPLAGAAIPPSSATATVDVFCPPVVDDTPPGTPDPGTPDPGTPDPGTPDPGTPVPPGAGAPAATPRPQGPAPEVTVTSVAPRPTTFVPAPLLPRPRLARTGGELAPAVGEWLTSGR